MDPRKKVLIDTDIGDDIDDAFALLAAMAAGFDIVGITTVFRNTDARARMTKKLLKTYGGGYEAVPVYAGFPSYTQEAEPNNEHMCRFTEDLNCPEYAPENTNPEAAVDFIIDCCNRYGSELSVIALGPFCNIAKVIEKDPQALGRVEKVAIMGGAYFKQYADWNVMCDVPAADTMFRSLPNLECMGADVTHLLAADDRLTQALSRAQSGALGYISQLYRAWQADNPASRIVLHDVLVVYYVLDPSICAMQRIHAAVIRDGFAKGLTLNVGAYSKASLNDAYRGYDFSRSVLAASSVDLPKFHQFIHRDISACLGSEGQPCAHLRH